MAYAVRTRGIVVGHAELVPIDRSMGVAAGSFVPTAAYDRVRAIFRRFAESVGETSAQITNEAGGTRYYAERDALELELVDDRLGVISTTAVHILDFEDEAGPGEIELEVIIDDPKFWDRFPSEPELPDHPSNDR